MNSKFVISIFAFFTLIIILVGCEKQEKGEELHTLQTLYEEAEVKLCTLQEDLEKAHAEIISLQEEKDKAETELEELYSMLERIHLSPIDSDFPEDFFQKQWMLGENINVWKVPAGVEGLPKQLIGRIDLSYYMVKVIGAIYDGDGIGLKGTSWVLVEFMERDTALDTVGWVKMDDLVEYTEETKYLLRYPLTLTEDAVNVESGQREIYFDGPVFVTYYDGEYVGISPSGGRNAKVHKDCLIYPEP